MSWNLISRMSLRKIIFFSFAIMSFSLLGQNQVRWLSFEDAIKKAETQPRKIFIDVYTDWCGWCKKMDANTFTNDAIAKYLNENYYPVKFDAEYKNDIVFNGKTYKFIKTYRGGYHELATEILSGKLSFPSTVFIDEYGDIIQAIPGYQDIRSLDMILHYFGENHHKTTPWRKYEKNYKMGGELGFPCINNKN